jgi:very-short-patch-repair endonuclease
VDFLINPNIVVECEGIVHSRRREEDLARTVSLERVGYQVWRLPNYCIFEDPSSIAQMLKEAQRNASGFA